MGLIALALSCGGSEEQHAQGDAVVDDRGQAHSVGAPRSRILSLVPGVTETLVSIGARGVLVAKTEYDTQEVLAHLPSVGGGLDPSLESLVDLSPDLIIMWGDRGGTGSLSGRLDELGIEVYQAEVEGMSDFRRHARNVGALVGHLPAADSLVNWVDQGLERTRATVSSEPRPTLFYVVQQDPPMGVGPGNFLDSLIAVAGGENILSDALGQWPLVSVEDVLWKNPDYIVVPVLGLADALPEEQGTLAPLARLASTPGWKELDAVREGRLLAVDADLFSRAGPRMAEAAMVLASQLHPAAFELGSDNR